MATAIFGLIGVVIGVLLTTLKDWWFERANKRDDQIYLAIHVSCLLEQVIHDCVSVAYDNGLYQGQRDQNDCLAVQVPPPEFKLPRLKDVNWKSLPTELMYRILRLPSELQDVDSYISSISEHVASPPDYEDVFEARKEKYSELGLKALKLLEDVCTLAGLPNELNKDDEWGPSRRLSATLEQVKAEKLQRHAYVQVPPSVES